MNKPGWEQLPCLVKHPKAVWLIFGVYGSGGLYYQSQMCVDHYSLAVTYFHISHISRSSIIRLYDLCLEYIAEESGGLHYKWKTCVDPLFISSHIASCFLHPNGVILLGVLEKMSSVDPPALNFRRTPPLLLWTIIILYLKMTPISLNFAIYRYFGFKLLCTII